MDVSSYQSSFYRIDKKHPDLKMVQPYLIFSTDDFTTGDFYLKANDLVLNVGSSPIIAVNLLMKYHHVFDVAFDNDILHFYRFYQFLFGVPHVKLTPTMMEFLTKIRNMS